MESDIRKLLELAHDLDSNGLEYILERYDHEYFLEAIKEVYRGRDYITSKGINYADLLESLTVLYNHSISLCKVNALLKLID